MTAEEIRKLIRKNARELLDTVVLTFLDENKEAIAPAQEFVPNFRFANLVKDEYQQKAARFVEIVVKNQSGITKFTETKPIHLFENDSIGEPSTPIIPTVIQPQIVSPQQSPITHQPHVANSPTTFNYEKELAIQKKEAEIVAQKNKYLRYIDRLKNEHSQAINKLELAHKEALTKKETEFKDTKLEHKEEIRELNLKIEKLKASEEALNKLKVEFEAVKGKAELRSIIEANLPALAGIGSMWVKDEGMKQMLTGYAMQGLGLGMLGAPMGALQFPQMQPISQEQPPVYPPQTVAPTTQTYSAELTQMIAVMQQMESESKESADATYLIFNSLLDENRQRVSSLMYRLASDMPNPLLLALIEELYMQQERIQPQSPLFRMLAGVCKTTDDVLLSYLEPSHSLTSNESEPTEIPNIQAQS